MNVQPLQLPPFPGAPRVAAGTVIEITPGVSPLLAGAVLPATWTCGVPRLPDWPRPAVELAGVTQSSVPKPSTSMSWFQALPGAIGRLFTPTLTIGALAGALAGRAWGALPAGPVAAFALIGAAASLAGAMQSPIASVALVVELTHSGLALLVPIALAAAGAVTVSRVLVRASLYTAAGWWQAGHPAHAGPAHRRSLVAGGQAVARG